VYAIYRDVLFIKPFSHHIKAHCITIIIIIIVVVSRHRLVLLLNQRCLLPFRLHVLHCRTFRITCEVPSIARLL
jgi:hypothetical protein